MKKSRIAIIAAALIATATAFSTSCGNSGPTKEPDPTVSLTAETTSFSDNTAFVKVLLSAKTNHDVTATLATGKNDLGSHVSFDKSVVISAGSSSKSVPVTLVDADDIAEGTYEVEILLSSATGADVSGTANRAVISHKANDNRPTVSISDYSAEFTDGAAEIKLSLDHAASKPISVEFEVGTEATEGQAIPAIALTFDNPVTIEAGKTEATVAVSLNGAGLSGLNQAIILLKGVSDNAIASTIENAAYITYDAPMVARLRNDWSVEYLGDMILTYTIDGETVKVPVDGIDAKVVNYDGGFVFGIFPAGYIGDGEDQYPVETYLLYQTGRYQEFVEWYNKTYKKEYDMTDFTFYFTKDSEYFFHTDPETDEPLRYSGDYELYLIAVDTDGNPLGDYTVSSFTREEEEASTEYVNLLGTYDLKDYILTVEHYENNYSYLFGIENKQAYDDDGNEVEEGEHPAVTIETLFNKENGNMDIPEQVIDGDDDMVFHWMGIDDEGVWGTDSYVIGHADLSEDLNTLSFSPATASFGGTEYTTQQMGLILEVISPKAQAGLYSLKTYPFIDLPSTGTRTEEEGDESGSALKKAPKAKRVTTPTMGKTGKSFSAKKARMRRSPYSAASKPISLL